MRRILVTGGAGFIGSHLTERHLELGDRVTVVDDLSTGNAANLSAVCDHPQLTIIQRDLGDRDLVEGLIDDADRVYHLAAAVGVALIAKNPIQTIERNIFPTQFLLDSLRRQQHAGRSIPFFLASTSEVYGKNPKSVWNEEDDLVFGATTKPRWSYGASKAIDEFLTLACHRECQMPVVVGRFFNVVGPRQTGAYGMVLPRFVAAAMEGKAITVHDDGRQVRCFAHVDDIVRAVMLLMDTPSAYGRIYNIGSDEAIAIGDLAARVASIVNPEVKVEFQSYAQAYDDDFEDVRRRVPDLSRLKSTIDYQRDRNLDQIIRDVWEFKKATGRS